ncbi:hypothetical protein Ancab_008571, partial [Ancistrocladus abbreviatus]
MNQIWIRSFKLRVNLAEERRTQGNQNIVIEHAPEIEEKRRHRKKPSYADVVQSKYGRQPDSIYTLGELCSC